MRKPYSRPSKCSPCMHNVLKSIHVSLRPTKAFDSVQYPVLLQRLFYSGSIYDAGINGRAWRLLKSWYTSPKGMVQVNGSLSSMFNLERGVLQGSVLSPVHVSLIIDPLLKSLQSKELDPFIGNTFAGAFIHADDIRTISSSQATLQAQINTASKFALENGLTLNPIKCEALLVSPTKPSELTPIAILGDKALTSHSTARCLGYWWSWDLCAKRMKLSKKQRELSKLLEHSINS